MCQSSDLKNKNKTLFSRWVLDPSNLRDPAFTSFWMFTKLPVKMAEIFDQYIMTLWPDIYILLISEGSNYKISDAM